MIHDNSKGNNIINYGRYLHGTHDLIYTQDDDCIVHGIENLYASFVTAPDRISYGGTEGLHNVDQQNIRGSAKMCMAGWGSMFSRSWISVLDKYIERYGMDTCFFRETDRIFSLLLNKHHNLVKTVRIEHLEGAVDKNALALEADHWKSKAKAIDRALGILKEEGTWSS